MSLKEFNKTTSIQWSINSDNFEYFKLRELRPNTDYPLRGMFITPDSGYGEGAVFITDTCYVNIPARYIQLIKDVTASEEAVAKINAGTESWRYTIEHSKRYNRDAFVVHLN